MQHGCARLEMNAAYTEQTAVAGERRLRREGETGCSAAVSAASGGVCEGITWLQGSVGHTGGEG